MRLSFLGTSKSNANPERDRGAGAALNALVVEKQATTLEPGCCIDPLRQPSKADIARDESEKTMPPVRASLPRAQDDST